MRDFENTNPIVVTVYFFAVSGVCMFSMHPILLALSFFGALGYCLARRGTRRVRFHLAMLAFLIVGTIINPIVSSAGATQLFFINDSPVTLEAIAYGLVASGAVVGVIYWFCSYTEIMTSDKLLYVLSRLSPKVSLVLSMALRYVALLSEQRRKIRQTQIAIGLYSDGNIIDRVRGEMRVFSVLVSFALENGIITADSMAARGYGSGKRTSFAIFRFSARDIATLALTLLLFALTVASLATGALDFEFYPTLSPISTGVWSVIGYISYGMLVLLPTFAEMEERARWKYLRSKI
jgi:energy-coupling factor transport system permease protein